MNDELRHEEGNQEGGRSKALPILFTTKEAAAFCMISESSFYKLNKKRMVPKPLRIGTMYRWRKNDLVSWVEAGCPKNWNGGKQQ